MRNGLRGRALVLWVLGVWLLPGLFFLAPWVAVQAQAETCNTSGPSSNAYTVALCITSPGNGAAVSGDLAVTATATVANARIGVQRMVFYLNGVYLLTDYQAPYTFVIPTTRWADGEYTLSAEALLRDAFVSKRTAAVLRFKNGTLTEASNHALFEPSTGTTPANGAPFVVAAAGDGASGEMNAEKVAKLIASIQPNLFLYLGDVYEKGTLTEFYNWYGTRGSSFSAFRDITNPTIGNHEYLTGNAQGYFTYWDNIPNYYSFDAGGWHFVSLNSNGSFAGTGAKSAQYQWLASDLEANADACTIVYYHHALFNIGPEGPTENLADIWALMAKNQVVMVLNGHDHTYQRWVPLDASGKPGPGGITEFIAGGGGHGLQTIDQTDSRVAYSNDANPDSFGVLKLTLSALEAEFSYVNINNVILDSGRIPCVKAGKPAEPAASPAPTGRPADQGTLPAPTRPPLRVPETGSGAGSPSPTQTLPLLPAATSAAQVSTPGGAPLVGIPSSVAPTTRAAVTNSAGGVNLPSPSSPEEPIILSFSHVIALGGLAAVILIGLFIIARRQA